MEMKKKNIFTIIGFIIAVIFLGASITGDKFPVGTTHLHDSTSSIFTINKNVYIGGNVRVTGVNFKELGSSITEDLDGIVATSDFYTFQTLHEEPVMILDSVSGLNLLYGNAQFDNYTKLGGSSAPAIKQKLITGVLPDTTNIWKNYAHGLSSRSRILGIQWSVRDDSLSKTYVGGYNQSNPVVTGFLVEANNSNISYFLPNLSLNLKKDTILFLVTYKE